MVQPIKFDNLITKRAARSAVFVTLFLTSTISSTLAYFDSESTSSSPPTPNDNRESAERLSKILVPSSVISPHEEEDRFINLGKRSAGLPETEMIGNSRSPGGGEILSPTSDEYETDLDDLAADEYVKRDPSRYAFGLGKRGLGGQESRYSFGIGKRLPEMLRYSTGSKRLPNRFQFGLGKKSRYSFGLGKRDLYEYIKRRYNFGIGKRSPAQRYAFGLGK